MIARPNETENGQQEQPFSYAILTDPEGAQYAAFREPAPPPKGFPRWAVYVLVACGALAALSGLASLTVAHAASAEAEALRGDLERVKRYFREQGVSLPSGSGHSQGGG